MDEAARRKRLGQYFTGVGLGRLLAALANCNSAKAIIDPMAGSGDILAACLDLGAHPQTLGAVDIDPIARNACAKRIPSSNPILGSAFNPKTLAKLPLKQWDLVITNPPYVRYQSLAQGAGESFKLPSAIEVRNGLLAAIDMQTSLDSEDKKLLKHLAFSYSGLADLAVPSWILCAAICAPGGRLALVVPESWLSRDFAAVVHYILLRWFRIEFIVEDAHAAWFNDAQVKTTLLIAKRISRKASAFSWTDEDKFLKIRVSRHAIGTKGVVDCLYPGASNPEELFAKDARNWLISGQSINNDMLDVQQVSLSQSAANLLRSCKKQKWIQTMADDGEHDIPESGDYALPSALNEWLSAASKAPSLTTLGDLGVQVGQGLRTGANGFFYASALGETSKGTKIQSDAALGKITAIVRPGLALPVLRKQSELPDSYIVKASDLPGRVLALQTCALKSDIEAGGTLAQSAYKIIPESLAKWIKVAENTNFGTDNEPKKITELSAVAPNVRKGNAANMIAPRFWYMLPDFAPRHKPDLLVARINQGAPRALLNENREAIIDANFASIWLENNAIPDVWALLAFLNSSWCIAALELSASVMGGGALKVEAAHIRRLPVPDLGDKGWRNLSRLGKSLANKGPKAINSALSKIDAAIASALLGRDVNEFEFAALHKIANDGQTRRENHRKKGK